MNSKKDLNEKYISFLEQTKDDTHKAVNHLNDRVLIVDGLNTFIRSFAVNPALNEDGLHVGGMMGFLKSVRYTSDILKPSRVIIVFDGKNGSGRRQKIYPEYKGTRKVKRRLNRNVDWGTAPQDEQQSMKQQMGRLIEYLEQLPLTLICVDGIEADDTMAYISQQLLPKSDIMLMSTDKDFLQLVDDRISVYLPTKKKLMHKEDVKELYGVPSKNLVYYRIFDGDKSDNIPGVRGIGPKTLINKLDFLQSDGLTLDTLFERVSQLDDEKLKNKILEHADTLKLNYDLMQLSEPIMGSAITSNVRNIIDSPINGLNSFGFKKEFMVDKLYTAFKNVETWLVNTWGDLDKYSKQTRK